MPLILPIHFDQLHHERAQGRGIFESVNRRNVGMIQWRQHVRLTLKSLEAARIGRELFGQKLQRDIAIQLGVSGAIDLSHPALPQERGDLIGAHSCAESDHHSGGRLSHAPGGFNGFKCRCQLAFPQGNLRSRLERKGSCHAMRFH